MAINMNVNVGDLVGSLKKKFAKKKSVGTVYTISIEAVSSRVKIMELKNGDLESAKIAYFPFDENLLYDDAEDLFFIPPDEEKKEVSATDDEEHEVESIASDEEKPARRTKYARILEDILPAYFSGSAEENYEAYVVLPNDSISIDYFSVPQQLSKQRRADTVKVQNSNNYKNEDQLLINSVDVGASKRRNSNVVYFVGMMQMRYVDDLISVCEDNHINLINITCAANAEVCGFLQLTKGDRRDAWMYVDIKRDETTIVVCSRSGVMGVYSLPYGYTVLESEDVVSEYDLYDHTVAELAIINATETAKSKKLTVIEEEDDDEEETDASKVEAMMAEEEADLELQQEVAVSSVKKVKTYSKKKKKLPKFMERPMPQTQDDMVEENFRIFLKRIIACREHCVSNDYLVNPDFAVVKLPEAYAFLEGRLNADKKNKIKFKLVNDSIAHKNIEIAENLDLYGANFTDRYDEFGDRLLFS